MASDDGEERTVLLGRQKQSLNKAPRKDPNQPFSLPEGAVKVKNTFINVEDRSDRSSPMADDIAPMRVVNRAKTAPYIRLDSADFSPPSGTPMFHVSELRFMEPAKVQFHRSPEEMAASSGGCVDPRLPVRLPVNCSPSEDMDRSGSGGSGGPSVSANPSFRIKNTFIDDFADDSSEETPEKSVKSCPVRNRRSGSRSNLACIREQREMNDPFRFQTELELDRTECQGPETSLTTAGATFSGGTSMSPSVSASASATLSFNAAASHSSSVAAAQAAATAAAVASAVLDDEVDHPGIGMALELLDPDIPPVELRVPEWSMGSDSHERGECKPCMWYWRPQGCQNKANCQHCHLCPDGAVQERRKHRRQATRAGSGPKSSAQSSQHPLRLSSLV